MFGNLMNDPEIQTLLADPEVQQKLQEIMKRIHQKCLNMHQILN